MKKHLSVSLTCRRRTAVHLGSAPPEAVRICNQERKSHTQWLESVRNARQITTTLTVK